MPLLERLNFISIFWSNLQEFFMVRVGSLTDLSLVKKHIIDSKSGMTPAEQLDAIYARCHELYPIQERTYESVRKQLCARGVCSLRPEDLDDEPVSYTHLDVYKRQSLLLVPYRPCRGGSPCHAAIACEGAPCRPRLRRKSLRNPSS